MKKIDLGQTVQILANVAVLSGIIFLIVEVNQNTQATKASSRDAAIDQSLSFFEQRLDNQVIGRAEYKLLTGEALDGFERYQLDYFQYYNLRVFENIFIQYEDGLFSDAEWQRYRRILARLFANNPVALELWKARSSEWIESFQAEVAELLPDE